MSKIDSLLDKSLADIRSDLYGHLEDVQDEYQAKGWLPSRLNLNKGVIRGLLELWCWGLHQLYLFLAYLLRNGFPIFSEGGWSDVHAAQVELTRKAATKAQGLVAFQGAAEGNVKIPKGRILRTLADGEGQVYRYVTTEDAVLADGETEVLVPVEAEEYGYKSNAATGNISELATNVEGITAVTNKADWLTSEGADEEDDTALNQRHQLAWRGVGEVNAARYEGLALSVSGIVAVYVNDRHPRGQGTVDVVVRSTAGVPTDSILAQVGEAVEAGRVQNDDVLVKGPVPVSVAITGTLYLTSGDKDAIKAEGEARLRALFEDPTDYTGVTPLGIGEDLTRDRLTYETMVAVVAAGGTCKRIAWGLSGDMAVASDSMAVLESIALSAEWEDA